MSVCQYLLLAALTGCFHAADGFSNGRVGSACGDMVPQHGFEPQPGRPPFIVDVDKTEFRPGDNITVSLKVASPVSGFFKGFLLEARDAGKPEWASVGSFVLTEPRQAAQLLPCAHVQGSGVSHSSSSKKRRVQATWTAPDQPPNTVRFLATVVQEYKVYWLRIPGPVVTLSEATSAPVTSDPAQSVGSTALSTQVSSVGCGLSKSCLREPAGCDPNLHLHCFFLSFSSDTQRQSVMFELSGRSDGYVAFALSHDTRMGDDDVYVCMTDGASVSISAHYASGRSSPEFGTQGALWGRAWRRADGLIQCRFHRNIIHKDRFNLNQSYFLFLAHGDAHQGSIYKHSRQPLISTNQKKMTGLPEDLTGSRSPLLIKVHGALMLTAWMWTMSTAVMAARHCRDLLPDTTVLGQRPWFQLHRAMMVLAVVLTGAAFTLPFIYRRGWSKSAGSHPYIGCCVMALSVIQPIMAALRPVPESPRRLIFRWLHFGAGTAAQIIAMCVFLGATQPALLLPSPWFPAMMIGWLLWIMLTDLLLLICQCLNRGNNSDDKERVLFGRQQEVISQVRRMVLVLFLVGNSGFLALFIKAIASL